MVGFYKHDIPAWMDGTEALSDGAYRAYHVIVQLIMLNEGPIARNERGIAGRCNQPVRAFGKHLQELLAAKKLTIDGSGRIANGRAEIELESVRNNRVNAGKGGKISGNSRKTSEKSQETSEKSQKTSELSEKTSEKIPDQSANPLKNNDVGQAALPDDGSLKEKRREEKTREEKSDGAASIEEPLPWEVEQSKPEAKAYAFVEGIIRLTEQDYQKLKRTYQGLNLDAELMGIAPWAAERAKEKGGNWYQPMIGALNKKLGKVQEQARQAKANAEAMAAKAVKYQPGQAAI